MNNLIVTVLSIALFALVVLFFFSVGTLSHPSKARMFCVWLIEDKVECKDIFLTIKDEN